MDMNLKKIALLLFIPVFINSCKTPAQVLVDPTAKNETPDKLKAIVEKTGQLSDEDINVTVYRDVSDSVVAVNTTTVSRSYFSFQPVKGTGTGFFISRSGNVLTNYHVIEGASKIEVTLSDKTKWPAKLVGTDKDNDVAVIKVDVPNRVFNVVPFGDSGTISVGQKVLAIGSPYGLNGTLTTGIISSINRTLPAEDGTVLKDIIQTDAAINPGNSGGPLLNGNGEVIGMNTAIFSPNGGNVGIGFAVPINKVKDVLKLIEINL
jgi:S1-C subfamily serine protease